MSENIDTSRRNFIKNAAAVGGGALTGAVAGAFTGSEMAQSAAEQRAERSEFFSSHDHVNEMSPDQKEMEIYLKKLLESVQNESGEAFKILTDTVARYERALSDIRTIIADNDAKIKSRESSEEFKCILGMERIRLEAMMAVLERYLNYYVHILAATPNREEHTTPSTQDVSSI